MCRFQHEIRPGSQIPGDVIRRGSLPEQKACRCKNERALRAKVGRAGSKRQRHGEPRRGVAIRRVDMPACIKEVQPVWTAMRGVKSEYGFTRPLW